MRASAGRAIQSESPHEGETDQGWGRLGWETWLAVAATVIVLAVATIPQLPPGVCYGDAGDLQLASATLGVMHPPGYPGYVTIGYLLTRVPGVDPAYLVTLLCLVSGLAAVALCVLVQVRLGVSPWLACALTLALSCHLRVWLNLIEPEIYGMSLAFLAGAVYWLIRAVRVRSKRTLYVAALLFGVVLANRPTVIWTLPFVVFVWWWHRHYWDATARRGLLTFIGLAAVAAAPGLYSLAYVWVRDQPDTPHNYIESYNAEFHTMGNATDGWRAKADRLVWQVTAHEFGRYLVESVRDMHMRLRWLYLQFFRYRTMDFLGRTFVLGPMLAPLVALILTVGGVLTFRRCRASFWLLIGMALGNTVFVCTYRINGLAGDLLPIMFAATVLGGVALSTLFPRRALVRRRLVAGALAAIAAVMTIALAPQRSAESETDATPFLAELDMTTMPRDAVICSTWPESPPLWYARHVLTKRLDIDIVNAATRRWYNRIKDQLPRPVFVVTRSVYLKGQAVTPYRNIWRWEDPRPTHPPAP